jgi:N-acetylglucosamine-6-phosphate deacetylase
MISDSEIDVHGDWISLGGVDLQINGALGLAFPDLAPSHSDTLIKICRFLWQQGIDGFMPTLVTTSIDKIHRAIAVIAQVQRQMTRSGIQEAAAILGVHLEGPCLNPEKRGAHPQEHLQPLTIETLQTVLGDDASVVKIMTLAPELDATGEVIPYLRSLGITVSLGHSQATADEARAAFHQGASMVTHAFNAMPPLHHRQPGLLGAALADSRVSCGLIADGQHVCPTMMDLLMSINRGKRSSDGTASQKSSLFLVSDALSPLGLPDGTYPWDTREIQVTNGTARLDDGTLAGTTHGLLVGAQNLVRWEICTPAEAIALATLAPRQAIGLPGLMPGQPATLLRWTYHEDGRSLTWQRL